MPSGGSRGNAHLRGVGAYQPVRTQADPKQQSLGEALSSPMPRLTPRESNLPVQQETQPLLQTLRNTSISKRSSDDPCFDISDAGPMQNLPFSIIRRIAVLLVIMGISAFVLCIVITRLRTVVNRNESTISTTQLSRRHGPFTTEFVDGTVDDGGRKQGSDNNKSEPDILIDPHPKPVSTTTDNNKQNITSADTQASQSQQDQPAAQQQQQEQDKDQGRVQQVKQHSKQPWTNLTRPLVIAHRGLSGLYPEHTREGYLAAIEAGADIIECDVVLTSDLVPICRHDINLSGSTDAAQRFPNKITTQRIDGINTTGVFAIDLTIAEIKQLRAVQPWPFRDHQYDGKFSIVTLSEYLDIALSASRTIGVHPETKNPTFHNSKIPSSANTSIEKIVLAALDAKGYKGPINSPEWRAQPAFLQSFELGSLKSMARTSCLPMIMLVGDDMHEEMPEGMTVGDLLEEPLFDEVRRLVAGFGPGKSLLVQWQEAEDVKPDNDGQQPTGSYQSSGVIEKLHAAGLQVHTYTMRNEEQFVLPHLEGNSTKEMELFLIHLGVDGFFTDYSNTAVPFLQQESSGGWKWDMSVANSPHVCRTLPT